MAVAWCGRLVSRVGIGGGGGECVCCHVGMCEVDAKGCKCEWRKLTAIFSFFFVLVKEEREKSSVGVSS